MKLESLKSSKFENFKQNEIQDAMKIVGGYRADTGGVDSNGCAKDWVTDETQNGPGRNGGGKRVDTYQGPQPATLMGA